ncbi:MAG: patatin-like phospholipase family protein [Porphyromonadaceae bacterium]|nr:patatin-like phospholipase family protein [Porphyromonadaceae bacterium]
MDECKIKYPIGLALSGGSIKGFAHLGVLQYLDEQEMSPSIIAGTSAGALMGAFYADGFTPQEIFEIFSDQGFMGMTTFRPLDGGVFDTSKFVRFIKSKLRTQRLEALSIPMRIVATDLDRGAQHVFTHGPLAEIITASCSIPVLFNPMQIEGTTYVDGGLFRNFPASVIRSNCDYLIGMNLGPWQDSMDYPKTIMGVAERSWEFVFRQNTLHDRELCDLLLESNQVSQYGMFAVSSATEIMRLGYALAAERITREALEYRISSKSNESV